MGRGSPLVDCPAQLTVFHTNARDLIFSPVHVDEFEQCHGDGREADKAAHQEKEQVLVQQVRGAAGDRVEHDDNHYRGDQPWAAAFKELDAHVAVVIQPVLDIPFPSLYLLRHYLWTT